MSERGVEEEASKEEAKLSLPGHNDRWENDTIDEAQSVLEKTMSPKKRKQIPTFDLRPPLKISQIDHLSVPGGNKSTKRSNVSKISKSSALNILLDRAGVSGESR